MVKFVGRREDLSTLHQKLQERERIAICAISGMGGMGKTELALQYAQHHQQQGSYSGGICWLQAREVNVGTQIVNFARTQIDLQPPNELDLINQVRYCWRHWREGEVLVVLDDVQNYQDVKSYLPPAESRFKLLITTRLQWLGESFDQLNLEVLSETASLELLMSFVGQERITREFDEAKQLCAELGFLPLGLELVGRYLKRKQDLSIAQMRQRLGLEHLEHPSLQQPSRDMTAERGVAAAFELSWQELDKPAQQLGCLLSLFALAPIPWDLVEKCLLDPDKEYLENLRDEALLNLSLLERRGQGSYQLHQLIREFFQDKLGELDNNCGLWQDLIRRLFNNPTKADELKRSFCLVMVAEAQKIPQTPTRRDLAELTPTIPHLVEAATAQKKWLNDKEFILPFVGLILFYKGQAAYSQAVKWSEQCVLDAEAHLVNNHPYVADSIHYHGMLCESQGKYDEAERLYLRALNLRETFLGNKHPNFANSINSLAGLYSLQGKYDKAETLYLKALQLRKEFFDKEDADVATSFHNLAGLYSLQGKYDEAEALYLQALELMEKSLGYEHPDVATSTNDLANLYLSQGRYKEAEPLYLQALELRKKSFGNEHLDVADSNNSLAKFYSLQGRYDEAKKLYSQALELRKNS
ncbi:MAG: tetratricopeptide repeat protein [Symploca sp. SIO2D2]|nr:tetratricopeptide repeat protein [Symploca sp. SIO2D2]